MTPNKISTSHSPVVPPLALHTLPSKGKTSPTPENSSISQLASTAIAVDSPLIPPPVLPTDLSKSQKAAGEDSSSSSDGSKLSPPPKPQEPRGHNSYTIHTQANTFYNVKYKELAEEKVNRDNVEQFRRKIDGYKNNTVTREQLIEELKQINRQKKITDIIPKICEYIHQLSDSHEVFKLILTQTVKEEKEHEAKKPPFREDSPGLSIFSYLILQDVKLQFEADKGWPFSEMAAQSILAILPAVIAQKNEVRVTKELEAKVDKDVIALTMDFTHRIAHLFHSRKGKLLSDNTKKLCYHFMTTCREAEFAMSKTVRTHVAFERLIFASILGLRCVTAELATATCALKTDNVHQKNFSAVFTLLIKKFQSSTNSLVDYQNPLSDTAKALLPSLEFIMHCLLPPSSETSTSNLTKSLAIKLSLGKRREA